MEASGVISTGSSLIAIGGRLMTLPSEEYRLIPLTQGQFAKVSPEDYEWLMQWRWHARWCPSTQSFYASRNEPRVGGGFYPVQMHREILCLKLGDSRKAEHANRETLNNHRSNLRIATNRQNIQNQKMRRDNRVGHKGVSRLPSGNYRALITIDGHKIHLGVRPTAEAAAELYRIAAEKHFMEFARTK